MFPNLTTGSLISVGQLCDDDCIATFTKQNVTMTKENTIILTGHRLNNGLWHIPLSNTHNFSSNSTNRANAVLRMDKTKAELVQYLHAACFSPVPTTFINATKKGFLSSFPGLSAKLITKHLKPSIATAKGHMDQEPKNVQSTQSHQDNTDGLAATVITWKQLSKTYSDQTGRFPVQSSSGNNYIFILYHFNSNGILAQPIKNRSATEILQAWKKCFDILKGKNLHPDLHILDNECSQDLKTAFKTSNVQFQLVPPHIHRRNAAERAIRTFKNHLIAGLATCDPAFPMRAWDLLIPQAELTLNLLRAARSNPELSAYQMLYGNYNFNAHPIAPPGTKVLVLEKPSQRKTFAPHGTEGWYVGPALDHYRCCRIYIPTTNKIRIADTVQFFPYQIPFPTATLTTYLQQTADDMLHILQNTGNTVPSLSFGHPIVNAYVQIAKILKRAASIPTPSEPTTSPTTASEVQQPTELIPQPPTKPVPPDPATVITHAQRVKESSQTKSINPLAKDHSLVTHDRLSKYDHNAYVRKHVPRLLQHRYLLRSHPQLAQAATETPNPSNPAPLLHTTAMSLPNLLQGPDKAVWNRGLANELGRLAQGVGKTRKPNERITGTDTIRFIKRTEVPRGRTVTYANFVCNIRPHKEEQHRVRLTVGGDKLTYPNDASSPSTGLVETKIFCNSVISDAHKCARFCTGDIKNFYLNTPMQYYQYMKIHSKFFPHPIDTLTEADCYVYAEIRKGMYGLKEAAILAHNQLKQFLAPHGYYPVPYTTGLWHHHSRPTKFILTVDDFGIKYFCKEDAEHLFTVLQKYYEMSIDWTGTQYCGLTIQWNYQQRYVDISMPQYIPSELQKLGHIPPTTPQHSPHQHTVPRYGQCIQYAPDDDDSPLLRPKQITYVQSVLGTLLYYARAVDPTLLPALNELATQQSSPTEKNIAKYQTPARLLCNAPSSNYQVLC